MSRSVRMPGWSWSPSSTTAAPTFRDDMRRAASRSVCSGPTVSTSGLIASRTCMWTSQHRAYEATGALARKSGNPMQPAVLVGELTVLDPDQRLADLVGDRGRCRHRHLAAAPAQCADGSDDGSGAAGEHLGDAAGVGALAPLVDVDTALLHIAAEVAGQGDDGVAGDAFEN